MAWIESHTVLIRHRKLIETARALRLKPVYLLGHFHALWHAALEQQEDGDLSSWTDDLIAEYSCYEGDAAKYVSLLDQFGWLDGRLLHDWLDYAGLYLTKKYSTSNRAKLIAIWKKHGQVYGSQDQPLVNKQRINSERIVSLPNQPLPTNLNQPTKTSSVGRFTPPSLQEVSDYCKERSNSVDANKLHAFYEANGWVQGRGKKIKDWKATVRTWEKPRPEFAEPKKRTAYLLVLEYRALKWDDLRIKEHLLQEKYNENEIDDALGKKF